MKHASIFRAATVIAAVLVLFSCNSSKDKKADNKLTDTTTSSMDTASTTNTDNTVSAAPMGPLSVMIVRAKVANFEKWKTSYESNDSLRVNSGLHDYVVARGTEDPNMVLVAMVMDDVAKAKAMGGSAELKKRMKESGVIGAPAVIDFLDAVLNDTTALQSKTRLMVRHKVKDWDAFKKVFDSDKARRTNDGIIDRVVAHTAGDPTSVTMVFAVEDEAKAKGFIGSPELKAKMDSAGVVGKPDFYFYRVVKKY